MKRYQPFASGWQITPLLAWCLPAVGAGFIPARVPLQPLAWCLPAVGAGFIPARVPLLGGANVQFVHICQQSLAKATINYI